MRSPPALDSRLICLGNRLICPDNRLLCRLDIAFLLFFLQFFLLLHSLSVLLKQVLQLGPRLLHRLRDTIVFVDRILPGAVIGAEDDYFAGVTPVGTRAAQIVWHEMCMIVGFAACSGLLQLNALLLQLLGQTLLCRRIVDRRSMIWLDELCERLNLEAKQISKLCIKSCAATGYERKVEQDSPSDLSDGSMSLPEYRQ